jgi:hypothetical protein
MKRYSSCIVSLAVCALGIMSLQAGRALGEDFRVENVVYADDQKEPASQTTTVFHAGVVYDYLKSPSETVVFDPKAGQFVLLNLSHQKRTEIKTTDITSSIVALRMKATESKDPFIKFLAEPKLVERFDQARSELTLSSPQLSYRLVLAPEENPEVAAQYRDFCDWSARLTPMLAPRSWPPFARLKVNAALAARHSMAMQVILTVTPEKNSKQQPITLRSEHRLVRTLEQPDLDRVAKTRESMAAFKPVEFSQYRKLESR